VEVISTRSGESVVQPRKTSEAVLSCRAKGGAQRRGSAGRAGSRCRSFIHFHPGSRWQFKCWPPSVQRHSVDAWSGAASASRSPQHPMSGTGADCEIREAASAPIADFSGKLTLKNSPRSALREALHRRGFRSMHIAAAHANAGSGAVRPERRARVGLGGCRIASSPPGSILRPCGTTVAAAAGERMPHSTPVEAAMSAVDSLLGR